MLALIKMFVWSCRYYMFLVCVQTSAGAVDDVTSALFACGSLRVTFAYDAANACVTVTVHEAAELPASDRGGTLCSRVRLLLLPTKKVRHKTSIKVGARPTFDETFDFKMISPGNLLNYINN